MMRLPLPLLRNNKAVSYTMSAVIITAVTVALVIATSVYAYQVLERQRGAAEFEVAKKSILAFNDALENVAWKPKSSRSVRFTIEYGSLKLMPDEVILNVSAILGEEPAIPLNSTSTRLVRYSIENRYVNFGEGQEPYILGDYNLIVTEGTESLGRALIEQESGWVTITLGYRTRAMRASVIEVNGTDVNYVNVWIVKVVGNWSTYIHTFDFKAKCLDVKTSALGPYTVAPSVDNCTICVQSGDESDSTVIPLDPGSPGNPSKVVFNVIVAEVKITL